MLAYRLAAAFCSAALILSFVPFASSAAAAAGFLRWGFYVTYDPASRASLIAHLSNLDVVVPGYFGLDASGAVTSADDASLDRVVKGAGKQLLPIVENHITYGDLSPYLGDAARRQAMVAQLAALPETYGDDGLTLDFEGVSPSDRAGLTAFVQALAGALHAHGKKLAVATPAKSGDLSTGWAGAYDDAAIGAAADWIVLMAYSYRTSSGQPGPISPFPWVTSVASYERSAVPAARLVLGIGAWGYDWNLTHPGKATTLTYEQIADLVRQHGGQPTFDATNAAMSYNYQNDDERHVVWFEDAASVQAKLAYAARNHLAGAALWRLGQEAPAVWQDLAVAGRADFAIPNGWYYSQAGADTGFGYKLIDDAIPFWREFRRLGGISTLGYPSSRRFVGADGFTYQAFQRGVLQWRPERGEAYLTNTFEDLTRAGKDPELAAEQSIPLPILDDGSGGDWARARQIRLGWLTNPAIAASFYANPNPTAIPHWSVDDSIQLYGLPASMPVRSGPFVVQRFQRVSLQLWVDSVLSMPHPGTVVGILGGDLYKSARLVPSEAAVPEAPF